MPKFYKATLAVVVMLFSVLSSKSQVNAYTFSQSAGTYTPITGGTVVAKATAFTSTGGLDDVTYTVANGSIPFNFYFNGATYTGLYVNSNGWIAFGNSAPSSTSTPISTTTAFNGAVSAMGADDRGVYAISMNRTSGSNVLTTSASTSGISVGDLISGTGIPSGASVTAITATTITMSANATSSGTASTVTFASGEIRYEVVGSAPNRTFVVQFLNFQRFGATGSLLNFQIRLNEAGGAAANQTIDIVYGNIIPTATTYQVGLRGSTNADYNNRTTTTDWMASTAGASNSATMTVNTTVFPASGTTFTFTPPPACTGSPIAGAAAATPNTVCFGGSATLSTTGTTASGTGITYQWQSAPIASSSWSDIPGATSLTYVVNATATKQYRLLVTCTATGLDDASTPIAVSVSSAPVYASYPFTETFENWVNGCNTNDRPGANWASSPATGNNSWRRDDQGTSASWSSTNGSYSPAFTEGAHSARFHSYNASSGTIGNLDLYIDLSDPSVSKFLTFDYINTSGTDQLKIFLSTDGGATFTQAGSSLGTSSSWSPKQFYINSNSATSVIRLQAISDFGGSDIGVDNLNLLNGCTGTPVAGTATAAGTLPACYGSNVSLSLTGATSGIGISYQWQSSPDGIAWTNIPGATSSTYLITGASVTMQYRAVVGCIPTGTSDNSLPVTVSVALPAYASLPYVQGFENWISACSTNDRPDAHWGLIPVTSDSAWRRDDEGVSTAGWTSNSAMYSPASSEGAHSARFHTWDAPSGQKGIMDLYIDLSSSTQDKLLKFDYINPVGTDSLTIFFSADGGQTFTRLDSLKTRSAWFTKQIIISSNTATGVIRFRAVSDFGAGIADMGIDNVQVLLGCTGSPVAGTITINGDNPVCTGGTVNLSVSGQTTASGITFQWQSSPDNTTWTDITGATGTSYNATMTAATYYRIVVNCTNTAQSTPSASVQVNVISPSITSSTPAVRCGIGTVNLQATGSAGTTVQWFTSATGGSPLGSGNSFTTPQLSATTSFYAQAATVGSPFNVGLASDVPANLFSLSGYGMYFSTSSAATINTVNIYPSTAGSLHVHLKNASGTIVDSRTFTIASGDISQTVPKTLALNFNVPAGSTGWQIYYDENIYRGEGSYAYPSTANGFSITGNTLDGNNISSGTRYYFYNWNVTTVCAGPRVAVTATVNTAPAMNVLPANVSICNGQSTTLQVNSANTGYTFNWNPGAIAGSSINVSPSATTKYIVTATDNSGGASDGCVNMDSITVTVNPLPVAFTITPATPAICTGDVVALNTGTGAQNGNIIVTAGTTSASTSSSSPFYRLFEGSRKQYLVRASELTALGLTAGSSLTSISINVPNPPSTPVNLDNLKIRMGATSVTTMSTFLNDASTLVYSSASYSPVSGANVLNFVTPFVWDGSSNIFVDLCFDNDVNNTCSAGSPTCWGNTPDVTMATAPFTSTVVYYEDNTTGARTVCSSTSVSVTSSSRPVMTFTYTRPAITWSPVTGLFTDASATVPYVSGTNADIVYAKPTTATTYTATASNTFGCTRTGTVTVNINTPPAITLQPLPQIGCTNGCVTLNAAATGSGLIYQWMKNGANLPGATSASLSLCNLSAADAGNYAVVVSGTCPAPLTSNTVAVVVGDDSWVGISNSDWNNPLNWCNGVPSATTNVLIPAGTPSSPVITGNANANNIQINSGASVIINNSGRLLLSGNLVNNGVFNATAGSIEFRGATNQNVPAINAANIIMNGVGGVTLGGNMNVGTALTLSNGHITLGNNNLVMTGGSTGSLASHIITNGTGKVTVNNVTVASAVFPVGPTAASYNPVMIANGQGRNYTVGVATGVNPSILNNAKAVNRTWNITANTAPVTPVSITLQYADADANGVPTDKMEAGVHNGTSWITITPAGGITPTGTAAARLVAFQSTSLGPTVLANIGGLTFPTAVGNVDADVTSVQLMPSVVQDNTIMRVNLRRSMKIEWTIVDARGRTVMVFNRQMLAGQTDIQLKLGHLSAGIYQILGRTEKGRTGTVRFVRQ